jgi:hypothetical protein
VAVACCIGSNPLLQKTRRVIPLIHSSSASLQSFKSIPPTRFDHMLTLFRTKAGKLRRMDLVRLSSRLQTWLVTTKCRAQTPSHAAGSVVESTSTRD